MVKKNDNNCNLVQLFHNTIYLTKNLFNFDFALKMKKLIVAILAFLYISTSIGATVSFHYCMGKFVGWQMGIDNSKECDKCGMEEKEAKDVGCCNEDYKLIKTDSDQKNTTSFQLQNQFSELTYIVYSEISIHPFFTSSVKRITNHTPFRACSLPVYLQNRTFLI